MRGPFAGIPGYRVVARYDVVGISGFRIKCGMTGRVFLDSASHRVTPHHDAGSRKVPLVGIAFAGISGYRVVARYDVVGIPGYRIKCGMTERVFLDSASSAV